MTNIFVILMTIGHGVLVATGLIAIWTWTDEHLSKARFRKRLEDTALETIIQFACNRKEQIEHWHETKSVSEAADICESLYEATHLEEE